MKTPVRKDASFEERVVVMVVPLATVPERMMRGRRADLRAVLIEG